MNERKFVLTSFVALAVIFLVSAHFGYIAAKHDETLELILRKFFEGFRGFMDDPVVFMLVIFANNAIKSLVAMLGGFFFGIFPVLFMAANGYVLGVVLSLREPEWGLTGVLMAILPHGILEIPAVLLACSYGVWLGAKFAESLFKGEEFKPHLSKAIRVYVTLILPTLFVAAAVEVFITPMFVPKP